MSSNKLPSPYVRVQVKARRTKDAIGISQTHTWWDCYQQFIESEKLQKQVTDAIGPGLARLEKMGVELKNITISFKLYEDEYQQQ